MATFIYPYNSGSRSCRDLSQNTGWRRIRREGSNFRGSPDKTVINWGCGSLPEEVNRCNVINSATAVNTMSNKLSFFRNMSGVSGGPRLPEFSTDKEEVTQHVKNGQIWVARTVLRGHSGEGIVLLEDEEDMVDAQLYTKYVKKRDEYRVHINTHGVFDIQRKAKRADEENPNWEIRNHANGFIYMRGDSDETPEDILTQARLAFNLSGLDFGAVDVIYNAYRSEATVLEINTSPGLEGTTLENYTEMLKGLV